MCVPADTCAGRVSTPTTDPTHSPELKTELHNDRCLVQEVNREFWEIGEKINCDALSTFTCSTNIWIKHIVLNKYTRTGLD